MKTRYFALVMGLIFLAVGVLGFVPALRTVDPAMPPLEMEQHYGLLFGLFAVNWLHNLVHILFGIWGVLAYRTFGAARGYALSVAAIYTVLTVMGFFPGLSTFFGLVPLYGNDIWLHALIALIAAIFASMRATVHQTPGDFGLRR